MKQFLPLIGLMLSTVSFAQTGGVGIGTTAPDSNAILELKSTNKTLLLPRLGSTILSSLASKEGMIAYDHDAHSFAGYIGTDAITVTANLAVQYGYTLYPPGYATQTYTAAATFSLQDLGVAIYAPGDTATFTLNIYNGTGITGTLLGSRIKVLAPNQGGLRYFDFSSSNIIFQAGSVYTFQVSSSVNNAVIHASTDTYSGGQMGTASSTFAANDLIFDIRSTGAGQWTKLATAATLAAYPTSGNLTDSLASYVNLSASQTISGKKTFSSDLIAGSKIGIGVTTPHAPLQLSNAIANRKLVLYETADNDHQFLGFGVNGGMLRYQSANTGDDHVFFSGASATTSTELMRIKGNGRVGIGTSNPVRRLEVADNADVSLYISSSAADMNGMITLNAANRPVSSTIDQFMFFQLSGTNVGNIVSNGLGGVSYNTTSDRRLKEHITHTKYGLQDLLKIDVMDYNMKAVPGKLCTGFIAQDLYDIYPQAVTPGDTDAVRQPWTVDYGRITPLLVQSIQDQQVIVKAQQEQIKALEQQLRELAAQNEQLSALVESVKELQQAAGAANPPGRLKVVRK